MKGTVVGTWINSMEELYGKNLVHDALAEHGWSPTRIITPMEDIVDSEPVNIVNIVAKKINKPVAEVWREIGRSNIVSFNRAYPSYFERNSLKDFLMMMDELHLQLTRKIDNASPPRLIATELGPKVIELKYVSKRGMFDYFLGLLDGCADFFNEKLEIDIIDKGSEGDKHFIKVRLTLEKGAEKLVSYKLSSILSAGIFKSIPSKIAFGTTVLTLPVFFVSQGGFGVNILVNSVAVFVLSYFLSFITIKPIKSIEEQLASLETLDFATSKQILTNDEFERINSKLENLKDSIKKDFLYIKGGTDDLHNFNQKFSEIAAQMELVSDTISSVVHQVADGAVYQAEETEKSVSVLTGNIENLNIIAQKELETKSSLEGAVSNIKASFDEVKQVATLLLQTKEQFSQVNQQGKDLSERVHNIMEIVTTVEGIADQTNLLALNAAIEAARAGEQGRGFAVVADEIRKLADDVKQAVRTINENLDYFINSVNSLVQDIQKEFEQLENSNRSLETAVQDNMSSTEEIINVSNTIVNLVEELSSETKNISDVFQNLHTLAAIAEENSASSEEMSANVMEYSEKIKELTGYIHQLENLTGGFKDELRKYSI